MSDVEDDRYLRYCMARLSAYRNVWWSLANEYDFMTEQKPGHRGNKQWEDWGRFFTILEKEDPYHRMSGIHNGSKWYDHKEPWVTHASIQTSDMNAGIRFREQFRKPVVCDECTYEGNVPQGWGNLTAGEMTQRFWLGTLGGCYVGHGETYLHPHDILWWAKGSVLHGESPARIQWLKELIATAPPFETLQALGDDQGRFLLGKSGEYVTSSLSNDLVYRFVRYAPGGNPRPEARPSADVTEGLSPLAVRFAAHTTARVLWDFGDGTTSLESNPVKTFERPGSDFVSMTMTDEGGSSARGYGTVMTGVIASNRPGRFLVQEAALDPVEVLFDDINEMRQLGVSLMPDGLATLGEETLRDLLTCLTTRPSEKP